jgi:hypothetical protein
MTKGIGPHRRMLDAVKLVHFLTMLKGVDRHFPSYDVLHNLSNRHFAALGLEQFQRVHA